MKRNRILALTLLAASATAPAHAGFEWKKPGTMQSAPASAPQQLFAAPPAMSEKKDLGGAAISGFGNDMPLAIALQQVVPAGYQYSFGNGVNPGTNVSWQGGKPWKQVLSDMLAAKKLSFETQGNVVVVSSTQPMPQMPRMARSLEVPQPMPAVATPSVVATEMPAPQKIVWDQPKRPAKIAWSQEKSSEKIVWDEPVSERHAPKPVMKSATSRPVNKFEAPLPLTSAPVIPKAAPAISSKVVDVAEVPAAVPLMSAQEKTLEPVKTNTAPVAAPAVTNSGEPAPIATAGGKNDASTGFFSFFKRKQAPVVPTAAPKEESRTAGEPAPAPVAATTAAKTEVKEAKKDDAKPVLLKPTAPWTAAKGATLRDALSSWAKTAGVEFYWTIDYDYRLRDDVALDGTFEDAVGKVLDRYKSIRPQPYGRFYRGDQKTLVVASYDTQ